MAREKVSNKFALAKMENGSLEDQSDYTQANIARYESIIGEKPSVEQDFTPMREAMLKGGLSPELAGMTVACAIEGWLNKASHASNKARNALKDDSREPEMLNAFKQQLLSGGWTNNQGGNEIGVKQVCEAYAEYRNADPESVYALWMGTAKDENGNPRAAYTEADKARIRKDANVQAIIKRKASEKAAQRAKEAPKDDSNLPPV